MKKKQSILKKPQVRIWVVIFVAGLVFLLLSSWTGMPIPEGLGIFICVLFALTLLWVAFFSQFVLPFQRVSDRRQAVRRLVKYMLGTGGKAIFIENGIERIHPGEWKRSGPGVYVLDTASGAVLRNDVAFTRVIGPGLTFTYGSEYLAGSVDLHRQTQPIPALGPLGDEDPFASRRRDETDEEYQQRQARRLETSGLTRDGVEVVPNITVTFRLERTPGDEDLSFGFNPGAVEAWVRAEGIAQTRSQDSRRSPEPRPGEYRPSHVSLRKLPAYLAVDVWREYLQKFTLGELFLSPLEVDLGGDTGLEKILRMVRQRLTNFEVAELDNVGQPTGATVISREFEILQDSGIRVDGVSIGSLRFKSEVERRLVDDWVATWLQRARAERSRIEALRNIHTLNGRQRAVERFAAACTLRFDPETLSLPRPTQSGDEFFQMKITLDRLLPRHFTGVHPGSAAPAAPGCRPELAQRDHQLDPGAGAMTTATNNQDGSGRSLNEQWMLAMTPSGGYYRRQIFVLSGGIIWGVLAYLNRLPGPEVYATLNLLFYPLRIFTDSRVFVTLLVGLVCFQLIAVITLILLHRSMRRIRYWLPALLAFLLVVFYLTWGPYLAIPQWSMEDATALLLYPVQALLSPGVIQVVLLGALAFWVAYRTAAIYVDDIYELGDIQVAQRFVLQAVFGSQYNYMAIRGGEVQPEFKKSPIYRVGGPGLVRVHLDNAALFEMVDGTPRVVGPTVDRPGAVVALTGFERLRSIIDLCDQMEEYSLEGRTRDGIRIRLKNVNAVFSVYRGGQIASLMRPYPFDPHAIQRLVYGQGTTSWVTATGSLIRRKFGEFIARHTLSEFLAAVGAPELERDAARAGSAAPGGRGAGWHAGYDLRSVSSQPTRFLLHGQT